MPACCSGHGLCLIPPHPDVRDRLREELARLRAQNEDLGPLIRFGRAARPGLNDGLIIPGDHYPAGTPLEVVRSAALERAPLRGQVRVVVVLADFPDHPFAASDALAARFRELFFARGTGHSVHDYYDEVSRGAVDVVGEVKGPFRMPRPLAEYAHGAYGTGDVLPNARTLARDAVEALAKTGFDFKPYDNDGNGFVDAFIVVHAGTGAETTLNRNDLWSHKWVLANGEFNAGGTRVYGYLTIPEDARLGVCCHELGHLLFGWPDLYDVDGSSQGLGNWCLMAGGSWNGKGDRPAHPSAWCKVRQGWVKVVNPTKNGPVSLADVKDGASVLRLWTNGKPGREYFLVENRQRARFDDALPGDGLLVYHVDDSVAGNDDERHPLVALLQADGAGDLGLGHNRGDGGDPFPGSTGNVTLTGSTEPSTRAYNNVNTGVALIGISPSRTVMTAQVLVRGASPVPFAGPDARGEAAVPERVRDLVLELYRSLYADGAEEGDEWRESVERRLAAVEHAVAGVVAPVIDVTDVEIASGRSTAV